MSMEYDKKPENQTGKSAEESTSQEPQEFSFLQETIKEEPFNSKKLAGKIAGLAVCGLIFGLAASVGFCALKPWAETKFPKSTKVVTIPEDEEADVEADEEVTEPVVPTLTIDNYRELSQALSTVAGQAAKSVVEVTGLREDSDWMEEQYDAVQSVSGIIIADNSQELLILASTAVLKEAEKITITFADGSSYKADIKKKNENLGMAIFSVNRVLLTESTWSRISEATLGNSNSLSPGDTLIALGKQFGYAGGLGYGVVSTTQYKTTFADGQYRILATDIPGTADGTGVLFNDSGEVVGMIDQSIMAEGRANAVSAFAISDLKTEIGMLSNGKGVPYIGIVATDVTDEVADSQGIPKGVYVKSIEADSPAMAAGIQNGDVITTVQKVDVATLSAYHNTLMNMEIGTQLKISGKRSGANGYVDIEFTVTVGSKE